MKFFRDFAKAIGKYDDAYRIMVKYKLWGYLVVPGIISVSYAGLYFLIMTGIKSRMLESAQGSWQWYQDLTNWFVNDAYWPFVIWLFYASYKAMVFALTSPVLTKLSETVEKKLRQVEESKYTFNDWKRDTIRALRITFRNLGFEIVICFGLSFVPYVGFALVMLVVSYYAGFGYMDYTLEREKMDIKQSIKWMQSHKGLCTGLGLPFMIGMFVPVAGWIIMPVFTTIAATLAVNEEIHGVDWKAKPMENKVRFVREPEED